MPTSGSSTGGVGVGWTGSCTWTVQGAGRNFRIGWELGVGPVAEMMKERYSQILDMSAARDYRLLLVCL